MAILQKTGVFNVKLSNGNNKKLLYVEKLTF